MAFKYAAFTVMLPEYTLEEAAALLKRLGYEGVEWRVHAVSSEDVPSDYWGGNKATIDIKSILAEAKNIKKLTADNGLQIVGLGTYLSYRLLDDMERCMEAAAKMGAPGIRVSPPVYDCSTNYHDLFEEAVEGFNKVEALARQYKVRANVELHYSRICSSASLGYKLVSEFDPDFIGVIVDPGNMICEGYENWQLGLELLGPYISHLHVKNADWQEKKPLKDGTKEREMTLMPLKEGLVSWRGVLAALAKVGYNGWLSFEDFAPGETEAKLVDDLAYLKAIEREVGG